MDCIKNELSIPIEKNQKKFCGYLNCSYFKTKESYILFNKLCCYQNRAFMD